MLTFEWQSNAPNSNLENLIILKILVQTSDKNFTHLRHNFLVDIF